MDSFSIGYANIALIKYWGKKQKNPVIPCNPSLSLRLDNLYSKTKIEKNNSNVDEFYINDEKQNEKELTRIINFINTFTPKNREKIIIKSYNKVPTAAGLSSSSSGTMALVLACNKYFNLKKSTKELAKIAKEGSGSACRSFYKMASWLENGEIEEIKCDLELSMMVLVVDENRKKISSREAMERCLNTSTNFLEWTNTAKKDYLEIKQAINENNFRKIGEITERNALFMHNTTKTANPPFSFLTEDSYLAMEIIKNMRKDGFLCYFTMDAGPNVKVLYLKKDHEKIYRKIKTLWKKKIIQCMA